jgi:hydroxymethylglutaryl-CoA lyase
MKEAISIAEPHSIHLPVLAPNLKGLERAAANGAKEVVVFASASEGFSWKNTNCSVEEALKRAEDTVMAAQKLGIRSRG